MVNHPLLEPIRDLHRSIRARVLAASDRQGIDAMSTVAKDEEGDTLFAIDAISDVVLVEQLEPIARRHGGIVLVGEGIETGKLTLPWDAKESSCRYRVIVDPIDGTRGLMYQKRPAWILTGVAPNCGEATRLSDVEMSVQTEIPLLKQHLSDELWAVRGQGAQAERFNRLTAERTPFVLRPSQKTNVEQGFASVTRFFPGARDVLSAIDDELMRKLVGVASRGKALCFEDQYASTGGQLYELMAGHDRFIADLRPLLSGIMQARGFPLGLCCHPYDIATALIAEEAGILLRDPWGNALDYPLEVAPDVAWVGYANSALEQRIAPLLREILEGHGLIPNAVTR
jgi:fructose-1,6-bisphosphatase/inositol monophosphatase family enzyme